MSSKPPHASPGPAKWDEMLTPKEFAKVLKVSLSWLAKARKRGDGRAMRVVSRLLNGVKCASKYISIHQDTQVMIRLGTTTAVQD
jgi:hypothetical protein